MFTTDQLEHLVTVLNRALNTDSGSMNLEFGWNLTMMELSDYSV